MTQAESSALVMLDLISIILLATLSLYSSALSRILVRRAVVNLCGTMCMYSSFHAMVARFRTFSSAATSAGISALLNGDGVLPGIVEPVGDV